MTKKPRNTETAGKAGRPRKAPQAAVRASQSEKTATLPSEATEAPPGRRSRDGTKQAKLIEMLNRTTGATVEEIVAAFGWQPHTVRGAIAGALKKKLGLKVDSKKVEGRGRVYRVTE